ncbi:hypothetical protein HY622_03830, partial [Candidatus Uhrbacteria bacterium]|nr:hypothetical protein [Candidatus Uhrbacteria bacterium]
IKVSSGHVNQVVGAVILQIVAALVGGLILIFLKMTNAPLPISQKGVLFAVGAGIAIGIAEIGSFFLFSKGVPVSVGMPIIVGGSIVTTTLLGALFLKESLTVLHLIAIALTIIGVGILSAK